MERQVYNRQVLGRGREIFVAGKILYCVYLIQSGAVDIVAGDRDNPAVIDTLGSGDVLGGMSLLDERPRATTALVRAMAPGVLITRTEFERHL
jgi:CRP-like cAMP-binding protein